MGDREQQASPRVATRHAESVRHPGRPVLVAIAALAMASCGSRGVHTYVRGPYPEKLSAWKLFVGRAADLKPNAGVVPYDLNSPLFTDYATKYRFVWMPAGTSATYNDSETFDFPVGTILAKTFAYKPRIIETRLLVHGNAGWATLPYVWNREQTDATLDVAADPTAVSWTNAAGKHYDIDYVIPNSNQCKGCHDRSKNVTPIGPKARNLNKDFDYPEGRFNQLAYWTKIGYLKGAPAPERAPSWRCGTIPRVDRWMRGRGHIWRSIAHTATIRAARPIRRGFICWRRKRIRCGWDFAKCRSRRDRDRAICCSTWWKASRTNRF